MSNATKVAIVVLLAGAVAAVVIARRSQRPPAQTDATASATGGGCCIIGVGALPATVPTQPARAAMPRLLDLGAGTCIPCKKMAPILEELKAELSGKLQVDFIDVWANADAARQHGISLIPTQIFFDDSGKELSRHEGFMAKEDILARFKEHGIDLAKAP